MTQQPGQLWRGKLLTMLPLEVFLLIPLGYFLLGHLFPRHAAQFIGIDLMQPGQQVFDPFIANGTHCPDVDFGRHRDIMEDDPVEASLLVIQLKQ